MILHLPEFKCIKYSTSFLQSFNTACCSGHIHVLNLYILSAVDILLLLSLWKTRVGIFYKWNGKFACKAQSKSSVLCLEEKLCIFKFPPTRQTFEWEFRIIFQWKQLSVGVTPWLKDHGLSHICMSEKSKPLPYCMLECQLNIKITVALNFLLNSFLLITLLDIEHFLKLSLWDKFVLLIYMNRYQKVLLAYSITDCSHLMDCLVMFPVVEFINLFSCFLTFCWLIQTFIILKSDLTDTETCVPLKRLLYLPKKIFAKSLTKQCEDLDYIYQASQKILCRHVAWICQRLQSYFNTIEYESRLIGRLTQ